MPLVKRNFKKAAEGNGPVTNSVPDPSPMDHGTLIKRFKKFAPSSPANYNEAIHSGIQPKLADTKNTVSEFNNSIGSKKRPLLRRSFSVSPERQAKQLAHSGTTIVQGNVMLLAPGQRAASASPRAANGGIKEESTPSSLYLGLRIKKQLEPLPFGDGKAAWCELPQRDVTMNFEEYAEDVWKYLFVLEAECGVYPDFLNGSTVTPTHRTMLLDWMTDIHFHFNACLEAQLLTVNLMDIFLMFRGCIVDKKRLQTLAGACISIAAKYEEIYPPTISDFIKVLGCSKRELMAAEYEVLGVVYDDLKRPNVINFLERLSQHYTSSVNQLARAVAQVASYNYSTCHLKPSATAAVAVYIAAFLESFEFPEKLCRMARVSPKLILELVPQFAAAVLDILKNMRTYPSLYKRMTVQHTLVFTSAHLAQLNALAEDCKM